MSKVLFVWDFDHTLFDTVSFIDELVQNMYEGVSDICSELITLDDFKIFFDNTYPTTMYSRITHAHDLAYTVAMFIGKIEEQKQIEQRINVAFDFTIQSAQDFMYGDSIQALEDIHKSIRAYGHIPVSYLISYGEPNFQTTKIEYSQIGSHMTDIIGAGVCSKKEVCAQIREKYGMIFIINDKVDESREMAKEFVYNSRDVHTLFVRREDGKYRDEIDGVVLGTNEVVVADMEETKQYIQEKFNEKYLD